MVVEDAAVGETSSAAARLAGAEGAARSSGTSIMEG
jgi:hypothetical protein